MTAIRPLHEKKLRQLEEKANQIRVDLIKMLVEAGSGHSAGPLGMADVFTALYFHILKHNPKKPEWTDRDRLILSNGHIVPIRYATMAHAGYFPKSELMTLRKFGSRLQGHPEYHIMKSLETTSGPLGSGTSQAAGMAYVAKMDKLKWRTYCVMGDGELDAGQNWEAAMFAAKYELDNMVWFVDRNNIQIDGRTENIMPLESLREKFEAFNFHVLEINGNDIAEVVDACRLAENVHDKPTAILAYNTPGKGVDYMENDYTWHGKPPAPGPETDLALKNLRTLSGLIASEHE